MDILKERYRIKKKLGEGGMSTVYLASDERLKGKEWAIKEMRQTGQQNEEMTVQFRQEAEMLSKLNHPSLPKIIDYFSEGNKNYLVMEYIEGEVLESFIEKRTDFIAEEDIKKIAIELCGVMEYLHSQNPPVIYRDLKPANIIITGEGTIKLIDFGIARVFVPGKEKDTIVIGTPGFAAPEQYGRKQTDEKSDIYSLGATLYNIATKRDPGLSPFSFAIPSSINPGLSPSMDTVILKALHLSPGQRFKNIKEMKEAIFGKDILLLPVCTTPSISSLAIEMDTNNLVLNVEKGNKIHTRNISIKNRGNRSLKAVLATNRPWLKVDPETFEGNEFSVTIMIDLNNGPKAKRLDGKVTITTQEQSIPVNVEVNIAPDTWERNIPNPLISLFMLLQTFIPVAGIFTIIITFFICNREEKSKQRLPFVIALIISILNNLVFLK